MPRSLIIRGVLKSEEAPLSNALVRAYDGDLPSLGDLGEQYLGEAAPDADGVFTIEYSEEAFRRGDKGAADLILRVFDRDSRALQILELEINGTRADPGVPAYNLPAQSSVTIVVASERDGQQDARSEYDRYVEAATAALQGFTWDRLREQDIIFLAGDLEFGLESIRHVDLIRAAWTLGKETGVVPEAFYAWARTPHPEIWQRLTPADDATRRKILARTLEDLISTPDEDLIAMIHRAAEARIVSEWLRQRAVQVVKSLKRRNLIVIPLDARLESARTGDALADVEVEIVDAGTAESLGTFRTDTRGKFRFQVSTDRGAPPDAQREFQFVVHVSDASDPIHTQQRIQLDPATAATIRVTVSDPAGGLDAVPAAVEEVSAELVQRLADDFGLRTFADIRARGSLDTLALGGEHAAALKRLERLADLNRIASLDTSLTLSKRGFDSVMGISHAPRHVFVSAVQEKVGDYKAATLHAAARAQTNLLNDFILSAKMGTLSGDASADIRNALTATAPKKCGCEDCDAAVSPRAYLADLWRYATQHLLQGGTLTSVEFLSQTFHRPFNRLPDSCEPSAKIVRQVRMDIEVLRSYLRASPQPELDAKLVKSEIEYRLAAYTQLLNQFGTSYDEIRLARSADTTDRGSLAERLGIDLTEGLGRRDDELGQLMLDPGATTGDGVLSETCLEQLFGLADTMRDPLAEGALIGDDKAQILSWNLDHIRWNQNTDANGSVHVSLAYDAVAATHRIEVFQDQARTVLLASATDTAPNATVDLVPENGRDIAGTLRYAYTEDDSSIEVAAVPRLLAWRLRRLRRQWASEDHPSDPYTGGMLPIIDPDLIGPDDFRRPEVGEPAFDIWNARRTEIEGLITAGRAAREAAAGDADSGVGAMLTAVLGKTHTELKVIGAGLAPSAGPVAGAAAEAALGALGFTPDSFAVLITHLESAASLAVEHWNEVYDVLAQSRKVLRFPAWVIEEQTQNIALGAELFWATSTTPTLTKWRASSEGRRHWLLALAQRSQPAIIDPDLMPASALADPIAGSAHVLWKARFDYLQQQLDDAAAALAAERAGADDELAFFDRQVEFTIGVPSAKLLDLEAVQAGGDTIDPDLARLSLPSSAFDYLMRARRLLASGESVLDSEWQSVFSILVQVAKTRKFSGWRDEEAANGITLSHDHFRLSPASALFAKPPEWRGTRRAQQDWRDRLDARITAEQTVISGMERAVSEVEESAMPTLRNALVRAAALPGEDEETTHTRLSSRLLIDTRIAGCQDTTRVADAISALQLLLFRLRNGEVQNPALTLDAPKFDAEMKWVGSYATWRSAMFVFLYPENLQQPELRRYKTPAFANLVEKLRATRQLTPEAACAAGRAYAAYIADVCSLIVEASCQTRTPIYRGETCIKQTVDQRYCLYMFGRTPSGGVYSSVLDPGDHSGYGQMPWREWPYGDIALKICGATPYCPDDARRHIYVFFVRKGSLPATPGSPYFPQDVRISFARFNVRTQEWDGNPIDLPDPPVPKSVMRVIVVQGQSERVPPVLEVWPVASTATGLVVNGTAMFQRPLSDSADAWRPPQQTDQGEWEPFRWRFHNPGASPSVWKETQKLIPIDELHATLRDWSNAYYGDGDHYVTSTRGLYRWYEDDLRGSKWLGLINLGSAEKIGNNDYDSLTSIAFFRDSASNTPVCVRTEYSRSSVIPNEGVLARHSTLQGLERVIPNWGAAAELDTRLCYIANESGVRAYATRPGRGPDVLSGGRRTLILPAFQENDAIRVAMPGQSVKSQVAHEDAVYAANAQAPLAILAILEEAFWLVPMFIGSRLEASGEYAAALEWYNTVWTHDAPPAGRKIFAGLRREESLSALYERPVEWLSDPLDPHAIARGRRNACTRGVQITVASCLLAFADAEFTRDTPESLPKARVLYESALSVLNSDELRARLNECEGLVGQIKIPTEGPLQEAQADYVRESVASIGSVSLRKAVINSITDALAAGNGSGEVLSISKNIATKAIAREQPLALAQAAVTAPVAQTLKLESAVMTSAILSQALTLAGAKAAQDTGERISAISGVAVSELEAGAVKDVPWLREPIGIGTQVPDTDGWHTLPAWSYPAVTFCIPPNPVPASLRLRAELNLHNLRTCRNIAGMQRELDMYAAATDSDSGMPFAINGQIALPGIGDIRPTMYRYTAVVDRAKALAQLASQIESAMLAALEKRDAETYSLMKAQQDAQLSASNMRLGELRTREAEGNVKLAELARDRAELQEETYEEWLGEGINAYEKAMIASIRSAAMASTAAAAYDAQIAVMTAAASSGMFKEGVAAGVIAPAIMRAIAQANAIAAERDTRIAEIYASQERRREEWKLARAVAQIDGRIASQQIRIAEDHVRVVEQEGVIARQQADFAQTVVTYLTNKFTNAELYEWMSRRLERVYDFFLQQATAMAKLAESQLAFERQQPRQGYIKDDYWAPPVEGTALRTESVDRKGLTGSARLLQDIVQLDQYAFDTHRRKLQISKTISLAQLAPAEFQRFRETGVLVFATPMELFDRDFPGHYLRLIRRVSTSVIALIPPTDGIHASLSSSGISRTVIGSQTFQTVPLRRDPETVALSASINASGIFDAEQAPHEIYFPFEGHGVDTTWELRLPKAANQFDFMTIADVLLNVDYTALQSIPYRTQVVKELPSRLRADRGFSLFHRYSDAWHDLTNPELIDPANQMVVSVQITPQDFPPNLEDIRIEQVLLYFAREGLTAEIDVAGLTLSAPHLIRPLGGPARTIDGVVSTRRGNAGAWTEMVGESPFGEWQLTLRTGNVGLDKKIQSWFKEERITDVLLVITYAGRVPEWPD